MNIFKYFGHKPNPLSKQIRNGLPIDPVEFDKRNLNTFLHVFRAQVTGVMRSTKGLFSNSIYEPISSQQGAFERLLDMIDQKHYKLTTISAAPSKRNEFLVCVEVQIPLDIHRVVVVEFRVGLCKDFVLLTKERNGMDIDSTKEPVFITALEIPDVLQSLRLERRYLFGDTLSIREYYQSPEGYYYGITIKGKTARVFTA